MTDQVRVDWECRGDERVSATAPYEYTDNGPALGSGPLDAQFAIPHEAVGYGKIIQNIKGPGGGFCAGAHLAGTTKCGYNWAGEVTFTKTSETVISDVGDPSRWSCPPDPASKLRRCRTRQRPGRAAGAAGPGKGGHG